MGRPTFTWSLPGGAILLSFPRQLRHCVYNLEKSYICMMFKYVLSTMGASKESISKFLIGNRFHVKLRIPSPENCKQSLQVKS